MSETLAVTSSTSMSRTYRHQSLPDGHLDAMTYDGGIVSVGPLRPSLDSCAWP